MKRTTKINPTLHILAPFDYQCRGCGTLVKIEQCHVCYISERRSSNREHFSISNHRSQYAHREA